ncbi:cupin domain-containing protein [Plantactinospora soyae]|uniref:Gentisate 1,2-dioxygenase n=1 Tax=Plantactinospora soyae TaxID=1544732 RepID=A0A927R2E1_9ACTN|nr:cupin domain-containing protein [Plantactinospora soyae]MBE1484469.1 gentisate 1,2-dioxygenase [Plantactinospora soyae]
MISDKAAGVDDATGEALAGLYRDLDALDLHPLWNITAQLLTETPRPKAVPWLWNGAVLRSLAERAIDLVPVDRGGERRVLSLGNPGLGGRPYAVGTLWGAIQCLGPRETAPAHRHSPGAIRFVLAGSGVWTTVDGDACDMHPGDLILTPGMHWHDHTNGGTESMVWFDGLDLPMIEALDAVFFEEYPEFAQPEPVRRNVVEAAYAASPRRLRPGAVVDELDPKPSRLLVYRWAETDAELARLAAENGAEIASVEFTNPDSGASVLPTLSCSVHRLPVDRVTRPRQQTGNAIWVVFRGEGYSVIGGQRFDWSPGDMFVVPSWVPVEHRASAPADLFRLTDAPVLRALGLYRERVLDAQQPVTGTFTARTLDAVPAPGTAVAPVPAARGEAR